MRRDIITAVPTAFDADGALDLQGSRAIMEYIAASGNEGALVLGTTGEFPALSASERAQLVELAAEVLAPSMRVIAHVGAAGAYEARRHAANAKSAGLTEVAVLTPYYLASSDPALWEYFSSVVDAADGLDVYIYVFEAVANNAVTPELMGRLAGLPGVVGAKISGEPLSRLDDYRAAVPSDFVLYTGADADLARAGDHGAQGVVSGVSSVLPKPFRELVAALDADDAEAVGIAQAAVDDVVAVIAANMGRMKAAYRILGVTDSGVRMAIEPPDEAALDEIARVVEAYR